MNQQRVCEASAGTLKGRWEVLKRQVFPPGATTFHLAGWSRGELDQEGRAEADELRRRHGFSTLHLIHGNALEVDGRASLIVGPPGVGKSTVCRRLVRAGRAKLLEDGLVLVGGRGDDWLTLETGTVDVMRRASVIGKWLRRFALIRRTPYYSADAGVGRFRRYLYDRVIDVAAFRLSVIFGPRTHPDFRPRLVEVERIVLIDHPLRRPFSYTILEGGMVPLPDLAEVAPRHAEISRVPSVGPPSEVRKAILAATSTWCSRTPATA